MARPRVAIFASGQGTTAEAFIRAQAAGKITAGIDLVITNNPKAGIIDRVKRLNKEFGTNTKCVVINKHTHPAKKDEKPGFGEQTTAEEAAILKVLKDGKFDCIVLMGYMRKVGPKIVREFGWRKEYTSPYQAMMLNTHAGLFPETIGLYGPHKQEHVIAKGFKESGTTTHVVAEDYDDGPTIAEHRTKVVPGETVESLLAKDQAVEKKHLPGDVERFIKKRRAYLAKKGA